MKGKQTKLTCIGILLILFVGFTNSAIFTIIDGSNDVIDLQETSTYCDEDDGCDDCDEDDDCAACSDCFEMVSASGDYLSNKLLMDPLFNDSFNYANELGFTICVGKWLVYHKDNGKLIGFIGLRTNVDSSESISLVSFERGPLESILMNFTSIPFSKPIITIFERNGGMKIYDGVILNSCGSYEEDDDPIWDPEDWEYFTYCEDLATFLNFRFSEYKHQQSEWTLVENVSLNEDEFLIEINDIELYNYAIELGYTNFIESNKSIFENGNEFIFGILHDMDDQTIAFAESGNTSVLFYLTFTETNHTLMTVYYNQTMGMIYDLSNLTMLSHWGYEHYSCDYWRCHDGCITSWLSGPFGFGCAFVCGLICGVCLATIWSPDPYSKAMCVACIACIALCAGAPLIACAGACAVDPCSYGHVCYPGTEINKHCADYYAGYYHTLVWTECNDIGMQWITHYDYCASRGLICSTSSLTCVSPGGGGGGCPNLLVWNGTGFSDEGIMYIHNVFDPYSDVVVSHILDVDELSIQEDTYQIKLSEIGDGYNFSHSTIDQVMLMCIDVEGIFVEYPLISAIHSKEGYITQSLLLSDDVWIETFKGDEITLIFKLPHEMDYDDLLDLIFVIEGHNVKLPF
ncbi:MAG: hypothetical protein P1Q69_04445 [Candidatus Thorarchaeota archaeon]|nr:hypothetical protein [Candidatus Thorarchaeota archaeon]